MVVTLDDSYDIPIVADRQTWFFILNFKWTRLLHWMYDKQLTLALTILLQTWQVREIYLLYFHFVFVVLSLSGPGLDLMSSNSINLNVAEKLL